MKKYIEIRWHGRAGQGTVSAAKLLAETAMAAGQHAQAFPEYGPEREGAPLKAYNRIGKERFTIYCSVERPDVVVVVDSSLIKLGDFTEGAGPETVFVFNSPEAPGILAGRHRLPPDKVFAVDATGIALAALGRNIPNTPMLGALAKATGVVSLEDLIEELKIEFGKKFSAEVLEKNIGAAGKAFEEVRQG